MLTSARSLARLVCAAALVVAVSLAPEAALAQADPDTATPGGDPVEAPDDDALAREIFGDEEEFEERRPDDDTEIIQVIGTRRESLAETEALSITAFDQASLDELGIQDVESLQAFVPSLHIGQIGNQAVITLRGIGFDNLTIVGEPGVIFQVDGVPLARPSAANALFFDVENVEVFRGPQGTQGSRQSTAGRIAITSAKPRPEFAAQGDVQVGAFNQVQTRAWVNIPLWEEYLMTRVSLTHEQRDGYQENILGSLEEEVGQTAENFADFVPVTTPEDNADDAEQVAIRGQLMSNATDNLTMRGVATYSQQKGIGPARKTIGPLFDGLTNCPDDSDPARDRCPLATIPGGQIFSPGDPRKSTQNVIGDQNNFQYGFTGNLDYSLPFDNVLTDTLGEMKFGSVISWQLNHNENNIDLDATNSFFSVVDIDQTAIQTTLEFFLQSEESSTLDWKVGYFNLNEQIGGDTTIQAFATPDPTLDETTINTRSKVETKSQAGYAELGWYMLDDLRLVGGIRYTTATKALDRDAFQIKVRRLEDGSLSEGFPRNVLADDRVEQGWDAWTPKAVLQWDVTDENRVWISATRGFKLGGFSLPQANDVQSPFCLDDDPETVCPNQVTVYDAEKLWSYEFASKNEFFDGDLNLEFYLFWYDYSSYQACQITAAGFQCSTGDATNRGIEVETQWSPVAGLRFDGTFNFLDAKVFNLRTTDPTERNTAPPLPPNPLKDASQDVSGKRLSKAPKFSLTTGVQYEFDLGEYGLPGYFTPRFQYRFQDRTFYRVFNLEKFSQDPFHMMDVRGTWRSEDDQWQIEIFVNNLTDEDVINSIFIGSEPLGAPVLAQYLPPRTWGIRFQYKYN